jgi:DNA (cytosine-5)-methyltransferase 1
MNALDNLAAVVDLFAGAGGLGIGRGEAGAHVRLAVELDPLASATLGANIPQAEAANVLEADITLLSGSQLREAASLARQDPLVVLGCAPCRPFSPAAYWPGAGTAIANPAE